MAKVNTNIYSQEAIQRVVDSLYAENEYIKKHPSLHIEDSVWKVTKILPLIDELFHHYIRKDEINLLDVGGGAGLILKMVSNYIQSEYHVGVNKFALDLSPEILEVQQRVNPDLVKVLNEDVCETSLPNNSIDVALMIDVLEHIPDPRKALRELRRISHFGIFKIPLEYNLLNRVANFVTLGRRWREMTWKSGHVNFYNLKRFEHQVEDSIGAILRLQFTNMFEWRICHESAQYERMKMVQRLLDSMLALVFHRFPYACSCVNTDFVVALIKCER